MPNIIKSLIKYSIPVLSVLLMNALVTVSGAEHSFDQHVSTQRPLDPAKNYYVTIPENGRFKHILYHESGKKTALKLGYGLSKYTNNVEIADEYQTEEAALSLARGHNYHYLLMPEILHWEDRATEWSGKRDRITISIIIYDVASGDKLDRVTFSAWGTWFTLGGVHPEDLLLPPIEEFVDSLFDGHQPIKELKKEKKPQTDDDEDDSIF
jgi:hypothetical protein